MDQQLCDVAFRRRERILGHGEAKDDLQIAEIVQALEAAMQEHGTNSMEVGELCKAVGTAAAKHGRYSEAQQYLSKSLKISENKFGSSHPAVLQLSATLGSLCLAQKEPQRAARFFKKALRTLDSPLCPEDEAFTRKISLKYATAMHASGNPQAAIEVLQQVMAATKSNDSQRAQVQYQLGVSHLELGKFEVASECLENAIQNKEFTEQAGKALLFLGAKYRGQGDVEQAFNCFQSTLKRWAITKGEKHVDNAVIYTNLAVCAEKMGDLKAAALWARRAVKLNELHRGVQDQRTVQCLGLLQMIQSRRKQELDALVGCTTNFGNTLSAEELARKDEKDGAPELAAPAFPPLVSTMEGELPATDSPCPSEEQAAAVTAKAVEVAVATSAIEAVDQEEPQPALAMEAKPIEEEATAAEEEFGKGLEQTTTAELPVETPEREVEAAVETATEHVEPERTLAVSAKQLESANLKQAVAEEAAGDDEEPASQKPGEEEVEKQKVMEEALLEESAAQRTIVHVDAPSALVEEKAPVQATGSEATATKAEGEPVPIESGMEETAVGTTPAAAGGEDKVLNEREEEASVQKTEEGRRGSMNE